MDHEHEYDTETGNGDERKSDRSGSDDLVTTAEAARIAAKEVQRMRAEERKVEDQKKKAALKAQQEKEYVDRLRESIKEDVDKANEKYAGSDGRKQMLANAVLERVQKVPGVSQMTAEVFNEQIKKITSEVVSEDMAFAGIKNESTETKEEVKEAQHRSDSAEQAPPTGGDSRGTGAGSSSESVKGEELAPKPVSGRMTLSKNIGDNSDTEELNARHKKRLASLGW